MNPVLQFLFAHPTSTQTCLYALTIISLWWAESLVLAQPAAVKWRHTSLNALFVVTALPIQVGMMLVCLWVSRWTAHHQFGLIYLLPNPENPWLKYGLMFVVLDLLDYVYHVTVHHVGPFWRFHRWHHTDLAVDVSTTVREHPGETFIRNSFLIAWVFLCGASVEILVLRQTAETVSNLCSHTAIRLPPRSARVLGWLFITPNLHHAHHHNELPITNRNYGDVFSLWDRMFGTFVNFARADTVFGLQSHMDGSADAHLRALVARGQGLLAKVWRIRPSA